MGQSVLHCRHIMGEGPLLLTQYVGGAIAVNIVWERSHCSQHGMGNTRFYGLLKIVIVSGQGCQYVMSLVSMMTRVMRSMCAGKSVNSSFLRSR